MRSRSAVAHYERPTAAGHGRGDSLDPHPRSARRTGPRHSRRSEAGKYAQRGARPGLAGAAGLSSQTSSTRDGDRLLNLFFFFFFFPSHHSAGALLEQNSGPARGVQPRVATTAPSRRPVVGDLGGAGLPPCARAVALLDARCSEAPATRQTPGRGRHPISRSSMPRGGASGIRDASRRQHRRAPLRPGAEREYRSTGSRRPDRRPRRSELKPHDDAARAGRPEQPWSTRPCFPTPIPTCSPVRSRTSSSTRRRS